MAPGPATGEVRPAGMEAAGCCEVTAAAWLVTTVGWVVTATGWPVTTPREFVWVRYCVAGLSTVSMETLLWALARAMAERVKTIEKRMLSEDYWWLDRCGKYGE